MRLMQSTPSIQMPDKRNNLMMRPEDVVTIVAMSMAAAIIATAAAILIMSSRAVRAEVCLERPGPRIEGKAWRWRSIDGRRCWYAARGVLEKSQLWWEVSAESPPADEPAAAVPAGGNFEDRWPSEADLVPLRFWQDLVPINDWKDTLSGGR